MDWQPIDFYGIVTLDRSIIEQIEQYLEEKERRLANQILNSIQTDIVDPAMPILPNEDFPLKLADAVEGLTKKIRTLTKKEAGQLGKGDQFITELNMALWEFTEVLKGCAIELFQQIKQVHIDRWHFSLAEVVHTIEGILIHRIEDVVWAIRRLDKPIQDYQKKVNTTSDWKAWINTQKTQLDPELITNLQQTEKFLKTQYESFHNQYSEYVRLSQQVEAELEKMKSYPVLALMEMNDQNLYVDAFRLLKLWELNTRPKGPLATETVRSLKTLSGVDQIINVLKIYYQGLEDVYFTSSLELKLLSENTTELQESIQTVKEKVVEYRKELQHLIKVMAKYREFLIQTNNNPYFRSRWGFTEWTVAPEPIKPKKLLNLIYATEELNKWYGQFLDSLNKGAHNQLEKLQEIYPETDRLLHEMGQPLISRSMMRNRAESLLKLIQECDEIGSHEMQTISFIEEVFSKAMRADWKYHVLHEFALFHEIYYIHQGLQPPIEDPAHAFRIERFRKLFYEIEEWVRKEDVYAHIYEIELDMNDMKSYLQDFLAAIQRVNKNRSSDPFLDETIAKFRQQLLEYRYIFGQFFFNLLSRNVEGQELRNQFLFVDQYFESIENLLNELKVSWEGDGV